MAASLPAPTPPTPIDLAEVFIVKRIDQRASRSSRTLAAAIATLLCASLWGPMPALAAGVTDTDVEALAASGRALIQQGRESSDISQLDQAWLVFEQLLEAEPESVEALVGLGTVALSRHHFGQALELGQAARSLAPSSSRPLGILVDALTELGRYDEAGEALEEMLQARPDLASYSRLSYYHELRGRFDLAIDAMERAVVAAGPYVENTEYARVLLGDLWLLEGMPERSLALYQTAADNLPGYIPALAGLAQVAAASGDYALAIATVEEAIAKIPLPDMLFVLAELYEISGEADLAEANYRQARELEAGLRADGLAVEPDMAILEADHGAPDFALSLAQQAYRAAPSIEAADALAWALYRVGQIGDARTHADEALRTGAEDPRFMYHAGVIALEAGDVDNALTLLDKALARSDAGSPLLSTRIMDALRTAAAFSEL